MNGKDPDQHVYSFRLIVVLAVHPIVYSSISGDFYSDFKQFQREVTLSCFLPSKSSKKEKNLLQ